MKTAELEGAALDAAVAKALGNVFLNGERIQAPFRPAPGDGGRLLMTPALTIDDNSEWFEPSTNWALGGPIIDRERIETSWDDIKERWYAEVEHGAPANSVRRSYGIGPTLLIAAMRAYVASKLGEEVELP